MSEHKALYRQFCESRSDLPLFFHPWWLDQVCGDNWEVTLSFDQGGQIIGVLPYFIKSALGLKTIRIPQLTPYIGAWLKYPENNQKQNRRYAFEKRVISELITQLPQLPFRVHHHPVGLDNGLPFLWKGYEISNFYTYRFAAKTPLEEIKKGMKASTRNKIKKANENLEIVEADDLKKFYDIQQLTFSRQGLKMPYTVNFFQKIDKVLREKKQRKILIANDKEGLSHAAIYLVWDQKTLYNLALGGDTNLRKSGAIQLLLWQGIQLAMEKGLTFDFEGSVIESIEGVFRDFGAKRVPYLRTIKYKNRFWKALSVIIKGK